MFYIITDYTKLINIKTRQKNKSAIILAHIDCFGVENITWHIEHAQTCSLANTNICNNMNMLINYNMNIQIFKCHLLLLKLKLLFTLLKHSTLFHILQ